MLNNRNFRVVVSVLVVFSIIAFFATSRNSLSPSIQKLKPAVSGDSIPFSGEHDDEVANTLKGTPNNSPNPPYSQEGNKPAGDAAAAPAAGAAKAPFSDSKPKFVADKSSNEGESKKVNKPDISIEDKTDNTPCNKEEYVVMIDAGSSGSRVHVYKFDVCHSPPVLISEKFEMLKPGLSSFDTDTKGAASSLDPLLKVAVESVPKDKQGCTPIAVKATAGLRKLGVEKSKLILDEVRNHLENDYPFAVVPGDGISIMEGLNEGVYAWITTNYLLGNIGSSEKTPTAAVFDLGGGSTQIVFEPEFGNNEKMAEGEHKFEISFGGRDFTLYQFSHLGYGLMEGRNKVNSYLVSSALKKNTELAAAKLSKSAAKDAKATITLNNPCIPPGVTASDVVVEMGKDEYYVVNMKGPSTPGGAQCRAMSEKILNKDAECKQAPCSFNGVHQPSLTRAFQRTSDMYVFSFFYDRTNPIGLPTSFTVEELSEMAKVVCSGDESWKDILLDDHIAELNKEPQWCLDLSFMVAMLHTGYDIPLSRELKTASKIANNELGWCLGASLPLLDQKASGWKCKVKEIA